MVTNKTLLFFPIKSIIPNIFIEKWFFIDCFSPQCKLSCPFA